MQIPTGVLVDSWGARRLLIGGSLAAAAGTLLFGATGSYALASVGRAIVGASTAVGWVVTLKLATHWFPRQRFAMLSGLGLMMGNIGALFAQVPLRLLVEQFGWRAVALGSAPACSRSAPRHGRWSPTIRPTGAPPAMRRRSCSGRHADARRGSCASSRTLFTYRNTWLIFLAQGGFVGAMLSFTGLWGPPYLRQRFALPSTDASAVCSVMIVCWAVASPLAGYFSDRIGRRKPIYLGGAIVAAAGWATLFYAPLPLAAFMAVAALTSFACGAVVIGFAFAKESVPVQFLAPFRRGQRRQHARARPASARDWTGARCALVRRAAGGVRIYSSRRFRRHFR